VKIYLGVGDTRGVKSPENARANLVDVHTGYSDTGQAIGKPLQMFLERKDFAFVASEHFINSVSKEYSTVEINRLELVQRDDLVLYHSYLHTLAPRDTVDQNSSFIFNK
jgi:hypothetical protein